jgi:putative ABC transport system ATP-binding protein
MISIKCKGIKKCFINGENRTQALKGIDLEIFDEKLTLLVGPSGSGKTTLLSIMETILTPDEGELSILGHDVHKMNELEKAAFRNEAIGVVFQALHLIPTLTVLENVILPLIIKGDNENEAKKKGVLLLEQLRIKEKMDLPPNHLSRGQQQRAAIARALINDPKIILCDEPTGALDQENGHAFMAILRELASSGKRTVFVITHDHRIFPFADHIININDGMIENKNA